MDLAEFRDRLAAQLPPNMPIYEVADVPLNDPSATKSLEAAEYVLALAVEAGAEAIDPNWPAWIDAVLAAEAINWEHTTKSGRKKQVNLRDRLFELTWADEAEMAALPTTLVGNKTASQAIIRYRGSCRNDGTLLRPEHVTYMLEQVAGVPLRLLHTHRQRLILKPAE